MKPSEQDRLLKGILTCDASSGLRQASLEHALLFIRRRRRRRWAVGAGVLGSVPFLLLLGIFVTRVPTAPPRPVVHSPVPSVASLSPEMKSGEVRFITDNELLALFGDRAVGLIGKPGHQMLVFYDNPDKKAGDGM